ncbi:MAG: ABC transporter ATP-binding protein [Verrucomicrobiota bacterium]
MNSLFFVFRFGFPYLKRYWVRFAAGILLGILFGLTNASFIWATKTIFERLAPPPAAQISTSVSTDAGFKEKLIKFEGKAKDIIDPWLPLYGRPLQWQQAIGALLFLPFLMFIRGGTGFLNAYCMIWVSERVMKDLRLAVLKKLNSLSLDYFDRSTSGDLLTRIHGDTSLLHRCMSLGFSDLIKEPVTVISVFTALCILDWKLAVFALIFLPLCVIPIQVLSRKVRQASKGTVEAQISQSSLLVELLTSIRVIKAFNLEKIQEQRFDQHAAKFVHHSVRGTKSKELVNPIIETISMIGLGVIVVYVSYAQHSSADLVGFLTGLILLFTPIKKLAAVNLLFHQTRIGIERLQQLFAEQPSVVEPTQPVTKTDFKTELAFENVSFAYGERPVLENITLKIPKGFRLGIAGESGSGKSTLVNLLFRFYDPTDGAIQIDGIDLRQITTKNIRHIMALVSQNTILFDQTVAENIACGKLNSSQQEIEAAARAANAHDFIMQLPEGYNTRIGEQGVTLSGGQRQRLAIARAFVRNAPILVLDEATASLDPHAEEEVQIALDYLAQQRTVITVAHRLSTLKSSDLIIVLSQGKIVEQGSFDSLLKQNNVFAEMAKKQGLI